MASHRISVILVTIIALTTVLGKAPIDYEIEALSVGSKDAGDADVHRLKNNQFVPTTYAVTITLADDFATTKTFVGKVVISLKEMSEPTAQQFIYLNGVGLTIKSFELKNTDGKKLDSEGGAKLNGQILAFKFTANLVKEVHTFTIDYEGTIYEDMYGLYLAKYKDENDADKYVLSTQFQPTHARRLMPCFDEPQYKAKFTIIVKHPDTYNVLSNMVAPSSISLDVEKTTTFPETPPMSTYLLGILVSTFTSEQGASNIKIWSRFKEGKAAKTGGYSLELTPKLLAEMNTFTGVNFNSMAINKVDHVALPEFSAGAMENWGLVTYRESLVLYKDGQSTTKNKQRVCSIVAHELAHFWFGNLVTTAWWDNTWLNEGFATYFEYFAAHKVEKTFELDKQFVIVEDMGVKNADSVSSAKPLNSAAESPDEVRDKFSSISYSKGASIIRMLSHLVGETAFTVVLTKYIGDNKEAIVKPDDLWNAVEKKHITLPGDKSVKAVMEPYVTKAGLPLIYVELVDGKVKITQKGRFLLLEGKEQDKGGDNEEEGEEETVQRYYVPITYTTNEVGAKFDFTKTKAAHWLTDSEDSSLEGPELKDADSAVFVNLQASAYARVNYDDALWERIKQTLVKKHTSVHVINRAQIVDDLFNLARAGVIKYEKALNIITEYLEKELSYYPWYVALNGFQYLLRRLEADSPVADEIKDYLDILLTDAIQEDPAISDHVNALKKSMMQSWLCNVEYRKKKAGEEDKKGMGCIGEMVAKYVDYNGDLSVLEPDERGLVYCVGIREVATDAQWNNLLENLYSTDRMPSETQLIISGLGCTKNKDLLKKFLDESVKKDSTFIKSQDAESVFTSVLAGNPENLDVAVTFFKDNEGKIKDRYGGKGAVMKALNNLIDRSISKKEIDEITELIKDKGYEKDAKKMLKSVKVNIDWINENKDAVNNYVTEYTNKRKKPKNPGPNPPPDPNPPTTPKDGSAGSTFANVLLIICNAIIVLYFRQ